MMLVPVDMADTVDTVTAVDTERGPLMPNPKPKLTVDTVDTAAMVDTVDTADTVDTVMAVDTERGPLKLNPKLMVTVDIPILFPDMVASPEFLVSARDPLMLKPTVVTVDTADTVDTAVDTVMAVDTDTTAKSEDSVTVNASILSK